MTLSLTMSGCAVFGLALLRIAVDGFHISLPDLGVERHERGVGLV